MNYHEAIEAELDQEMEVYNYQLEKAEQMPIEDLERLATAHFANDPHCGCGYCDHFKELMRTL